MATAEDRAEHPSNARARRATPGFRQLHVRPKRPGPPPPWPLDEQTDAEKAKWKKMWYLPQAEVWREMDLYDDVALYVRIWCKATGPKPPAWVFNEMRHLDAKIGVSPRAMRNLKWEIVPEPPKDKPKPDAKVTDLRDRVKAVE